jgi:hypothetical protein
MIRASSDRDGLLNRVRRYPAQPIFTAICQNELDRSPKTGAAFLDRMALPIGPGNLRRPAHKPFAVLFNHRRELVPHSKSIDLTAKFVLRSIASGTNSRQRLLPIRPQRWHGGQ